mmetsp:Transcript_19502/g.48800  ORF Transcript_19502/g.48800 Transcript_19502/m.48800 type:complete len:215 (+) Transcript_19502:124-768(+)
MQKKLTAGMTVMDPRAKARKLVTDVMVMLVPARSTANWQRVSAVPPLGSVRRARRNASSRTMTSSTPMPMKMNGPSCARLVNGTAHHMTSPYPIASDSMTLSIPHAASFAMLRLGVLRKYCVRIVAVPMRTIAMPASGMSLPTLRVISSSNANSYRNLIVHVSPCAARSLVINWLNCFAMRLVASAPAPSTFLECRLYHPLKCSAPVMLVVPAA